MTIYISFVRGFCKSFLTLSFPLQKHCETFPADDLTFLYFFFSFLLYFLSGFLGRGLSLRNGWRCWAGELAGLSEVWLLGGESSFAVSVQKRLYCAIECPDESGTDSCKFDKIFFSVICSVCVRHMGGTECSKRWTTRMFVCVCACLRVVLYVCTCFCVCASVYKVLKIKFISTWS